MTLTSEIRWSIRPLLLPDELPTPETDDATTPVDQLPSMSVVKTQVGGPNPVTTAGQIIDYTIVIENTGNLTLTGIVPVDMLPNGMVGTLAGYRASAATDNWTLPKHGRTPLVIRSHKVILMRAYLWSIMHL